MPAVRRATGEREWRRLDNGQALQIEYGEHGAGHGFGLCAAAAQAGLAEGAKAGDHQVETAPGGGQGELRDIQIQPVGNGWRSVRPFPQALGSLKGQNGQKVVVALFKEVASHVPNVIEHLAAQPEIHQAFAEGLGAVEDGWLGDFRADKRDIEQQAGLEAVNDAKHLLRGGAVGDAAFLGGLLGGAGQRRQSDSRARSSRWVSVIVPDATASLRIPASTRSAAMTATTWRITRAEPGMTSGTTSLSSASRRLSADVTQMRNKWISLP